jgi:hypothetical protein
MQLCCVQPAVPTFSNRQLPPSPMEMQTASLSASERYKLLVCGFRRSRASSPSDVGPAFRRMPAGCDAVLKLSAKRARSSTLLWTRRGANAKR